MNRLFLSVLCTAILSTGTVPSVYSQERQPIVALERNEYSVPFLQHQKFDYLSAALTETVRALQIEYNASVPQSIEDLFDNRGFNFEFSSLQITETDDIYQLHILYRDTNEHLAAYIMDDISPGDAGSIQDEIAQMDALIDRADQFLSHPVYSDSAQIKEEMNYLIAIERGEHDGLIANWTPDYGTMLGFEDSHELEEILSNSGSIRITYSPHDRERQYGNDYQITFSLYDGSQHTSFTDEYALRLLRD